jgi:hypothetical protein
MTTINRVTPSEEKLKELMNGSAATMLGYMKDELQLFIDDISDFIKEDTITVFETSGSFISEVFNVDLDRELNVFIIDLDSMKHINKFAVTKRMQLGFRWLDDVIDNLSR